MSFDEDKRAVAGGGGGDERGGDRSLLDCVDHCTDAHHLPAVSSEIHPAHENIAALAYAQWQKQGCPEGTHEEHWLRAEQELTANQEVAVQAARS